MFSVVWTYNQQWSIIMWIIDSENHIWLASSVSRLSPMRVVNKFVLLSLAPLHPPLLISVLEWDMPLFWYQTWLSWWLDGLVGMDKHRDPNSWRAMIVMGAWLKYIGLADKIQDSHLNVNLDKQWWGASAMAFFYICSNFGQSLGADALALACLTWRTAEPVTGRKRAVGSRACRERRWRAVF